MLNSNSLIPRHNDSKRGYAKKERTLPKQVTYVTTYAPAHLRRMLSIISLIKSQAAELISPKPDIKRVTVASLAHRQIQEELETFCASFPSA